MFDYNIRARLREFLVNKFKGSDNRIIDEFGLCLGLARIDMAVINGMMHGYEIKSEKDTLRRLPEQAIVYNRIFDRITIVSTRQHLINIERMVPTWWGMTEVYPVTKGTKIGLKVLRYPKKNRSVDINVIVQLLWRDEALKELECLNAANGFTSKPKTVLWRRLVSIVPKNKLAHIVRERIKLREGWRVG